MKSFFTQFRECKAANLTATGPIQKFKDHPELLPSPFHRAAKGIAEALAKDPDFGFPVILCVKFGGECSSSQPQCKEERRLCGTDTTIMQDTTTQK
jgi:hypothetical protein